ncbi:PucR family transcriptional regulator [Actinomadura roseirufa]|uniref:PucR family transcriptional regulator n=1 Tax=Actinomadura roseirufa TaxID=2094049 RepID=UPI001A955BA8|nr:helix-turn-helix domain-containing protein [Actinomadura roseirufa]
MFEHLRARVEANARRAVEVYTHRLAEYRSMTYGGRGRATLMDFAVVLRRRTADLAAADEPFTGDDLEFITSVGRERGEKGVSLESHRGVLALHSALTLREVQEAAGADDTDDLMRMLGWLGTQGAIAGHAYTCGFMDGQKHFIPFLTRVEMLADLLLADDPTAPALAGGLGMTLADRYVVTVVRVAGDRAAGEPHEEIIEILLKHYLTPMTWHRPEEFVALVPSRDGEPPDRALALARDFAEMAARPCAVGTAAGTVRALAGAASMARQVSAAAPLETVPSRTHTMADVFVELGTAHLPHVDGWLREVSGRLSGGPALLATLDAYYRHDMNRLLTAATLHIHPRTLDYRLRRVRDLTGLEPNSTQGVRVLSAAVTRTLSGAWPDGDPPT